MTGPFDPAEFDRLLPFYINGTLDQHQRDRIEAALASAPELRAALHAEQLLQARHREETEALLAAAEGGLEARHEALVARLDEPSEAQAAPAVAHPDAPSAGGGLMAALALLNPRRWHPALALTLLVAVPAQAAVIATQSGKIALLQDENFQLAAGPCDDRPPAGAIQLELAETAQWKDVAALLDDEELSIARSGGLGLLTIKTGREGQEYRALLDRLRASPLVVSAEPAA